MPASPDLTHIRVSRATLARLREYIARYEAAVERGAIPADARERPEQINPAAATLSLDAAISRLLDQVEGHQRRGRVKRKKGGNDDQRAE